MYMYSTVSGSITNLLSIKAHYLSDFCLLVCESNGNGMEVCSWK
jgi:hypothetical protein